MDYSDFELEISPGREGSFAVAVLRSPAGEPRGTLQLPFDQRDLELRLLALENALLRSGATHTRRIASPDEAPVQAIGEALFRALLNGDILSCYDQSQRAAREQRKGLRLKLRIQAPELAALPWEFLYDPREDEYVGLSRRTPIVRYLEPRQPVPALTVRPPLRVLGLVASPAGLPELDVATERRRVEEALKELRAGGLMELVWLPGQTWADLQTAFWQGPWHIFHFIGHGGFDTERDEGVLALGDEAGTKRLLTATELGRLLGDHDPLRLAVLNACEGARGGRRDVFSSTAASLVRRGVPAVVAMQYEISDQAAIQFGARFYAAVAHGLSVDAALAEARISMSVATRESAEWGTPVLHTNAPDGRLFALADSVPTPVRPAPGLAADPDARQHLERQWQQALSYFWTERWDQAAQLLSDIVAQQPQYHDAAAKLAEARRQGRLAQLYAAGSQAYEVREWPQASEHLEAVVALDPQYRDAAALLEEAGRQQKLTELYAEARELHHAQAWQGVLNILERIRTLDAAYEDADGLEATAREALAAEQRQRDSKALLSRGLAYLESQEWAEAVEVFERLQREYPEHPDCESLLAQARQRLAQHELREQQKRSGQREGVPTDRAELYRAAQSAYQARAWSEASKHLEALLNLDASYKGAADLLNDVRRQQQLTDLYAEASRLHSAGDWHAVLGAFERIHKMEPGYADPKGLQSSARKCLATEQEETLAASSKNGAHPPAGATVWVTRRVTQFVVAIAVVVIASTMVCSRLSQTSSDVNLVPRPATSVGLVQASSSPMASAVASSESITTANKCSAPPGGEISPEVTRDLQGDESAGFATILKSHPEAGLPCYVAGEPARFTDLDGNVYLWLNQTNTYPTGALLIWHNTPNLNHLIPFTATTSTDTITSADTIQQFLMEHRETYVAKFPNYVNKLGQPSADAYGVQDSPFFNDKFAVMQDDTVVFWRSATRMIRVIRWDKSTIII